MTTRSRPVPIHCVLLGVAAILVGCSGDASGVGLEPTGTTGKHPSEAEMRAATQLALSNIPDGTKSASDYKHSLGCATAMQKINPLIQESGLLSREQKLQLREAGREFNRFAFAAARREGIAATSVRRDLREATEQDTSTMIESYRVVLGCAKAMASRA